MTLENTRAAGLRQAAERLEWEATGIKEIPLGDPARDKLTIEVLMLMAKKIRWMAEDADDDD